MDLVSEHMLGSKIGSLTIMQRFLLLEKKNIRAHKTRLGAHRRLALLPVSGSGCTCGAIPGASATALFVSTLSHTANPRTRLWL